MTSADHSVGGSTPLHAVEEHESYSQSFNPQKLNTLASRIASCARWAGRTSASRAVRAPQSPRALGTPRLALVGRRWAR